MHAAKCITCFMVCLLIALIASATSAQTALTPKEQLGKLLFFDQNLSSPSGQSCGCCHDPAAGFADPRRFLPVSNGANGNRVGSRNAPTVSYCSQSPAFHFDVAEGKYAGGQFWDGHSAGMVDQATKPFLNPLEMNNHNIHRVVQMVRHSSYAGLFRQVYGDDSFTDAEMAYGMIADAIATYENSNEVNPFTSKFDQYLKGEARLNRLETLGHGIFEGKGGCSGCHPSQVGPGGSPPLFTDYTYENVGVPRNPDNPYYQLQPSLNKDGEAWVDYGLGAVLGLPGEMGKMKVPTLRNVALTAPYGHNGYFDSLREMVAFCANSVAVQQGRKAPGRPRMETAMARTGPWPSPEVPENVNVMQFGNARLGDEEIDAVVAFLNTLTDGYARPGHKDPGRPRIEPVEASTPVVMGISPNPFNPVTRIEYSVDAPSTVRIGVYDVAGRLVRSLVDEAVPAGVHAATWDGRDARGAPVASGIYFVQLDTGTRTVVSKAVLTR